MYRILGALFAMSGLAACTTTENQARTPDGAPLGNAGRTFLSSGQRPALTPAQEANRDVLVRQAVAKAIASSIGFGSGNLFFRRTYSNALVSGPHWDTGVFGGELKYYCAKARVGNLDITGDHDIAFEALILEGPRGISVNGHRSYGTPRCTTPYRPFPELEAYNHRS